MKKHFFLVFALIFALSLASCSSGSPSRPDPTDDSVVSTVPESGPDGTQSDAPDGAGSQEEPVLPEYVYSSSLDVYSISQETFVRSGDKSGDLSELGADEYYSAVLHMQYNGDATLSWSELAVSVDGGERWLWSAGSLAPGQTMDLHVYYANMQHMTEGLHSIAWYFDGVEVYSDTFMITRDLNWGALTTLPTRSEIDAANATASLRSPYMAVWLTIPDGTRYKEYTIDFKADYFPVGSYYSLGNWYMDFPELEQQYTQIVSDSGGIQGYAGFQNINSGEHMGIMSFWDLHCTDAAGNVTTLRPTVIYPENPYQSEEFGGEGVGAKCLDPYPWEENHWYRFHIRCTDNAVTGTTEVEFWVCDLEQGEYTLICAYDMGTGNAAFQGSIAIFLENYLPSTAGEIRTLEVCNPQYLDEATGQWCAITEGYMIPTGDGMGMSYTGSYDYGMEVNRLWIMTTGVGSSHDDSAGYTLHFGS